MNKFLVCQPEAIESTTDFERLIDRTGMMTGRFILSIPSDWEQQIRLRMGELPPVQKKKFNRLLELGRNNRCVYRVKNSQSAGGWLDSIKLRFNEGQPRVDLALTKDYEDLPRIIPFSDWFPEPIEDATLPATPDYICRSCLVTITTSSEVYLVDPYLNLNLKKFRDSVDGLLELAKGNKALKKFVFFTTSKAFRDVKPSEDELSVFRNVKNKFKSCFDVQFFSVDDSHSSEKLHMRFLASNSGGVRVESGFETRLKVGRTNFSPLTRGMINDFWNRFVYRLDETLIFQELV